MRRLVAYGLLGAVCAGTAIGWTLGAGLAVVTLLLTVATVACAVWWAVRVDEARPQRRVVARHSAVAVTVAAPTVLGAELVDLRASRAALEEVEPVVQGTGAVPAGLAAPAIPAPVELPVGARVALPDALSA